jgi:hypothetical protein
LETSLSGDDILLIFPDGTGPAVLSALLAGIPLNRVHELEFRPGELWLDVNYETVQHMWPSKPPESYVEALERGKKQLEVLRHTDPEQILNVREQREKAEQEAAAKQAAAKLAKEQQEAE